MNVLKIYTIHMTRYYRMTKLQIDDLKFWINITVRLLTEYLVTVDERLLYRNHGNDAVVDHAD